MTIDRDAWSTGVVIDAGEELEVTARIDRGGGDRRASGIVRSPNALPAGKAMSLRLDDGRRALIVVVDDRGRFLASEGFWESRDGHPERS